MNKMYVRRSSITTDDYVLILEEESVDVPENYDDGGEPPLVRLVVQHDDRSFVCHSLEAFSAIAKEIDFPMSAFCLQNPCVIATMIISIERMNRPIQNNRLFEFLESDERFKLAELEPRFENGNLVWFELQGFAPDVRQRRFSASTLNLIEDELM